MDIWHVAPVVPGLIIVYTIGIRWSFVILLCILICAYCISEVIKNINNIFAPNTESRIEKQNQQLRKMHDFLKILDQESRKAKRLPAVFGRTIDDVLQQLIDLILKDFVVAWNAEQGFSSSNQLCIDLKEDIWKVVQNFQARLATVDEAKLICDDFVSRVTFHFQRIRLTREATEIGRAPAHSLPPHLESSEAEKDYIRQLVSALMTFLFPISYMAAQPVKHILREFITCKVLYPAIETVTNPDFINQKILAWLSSNLPSSNMQCKNAYNCPETYDDFVQMIRESTDVQVLKQIRYDIVVEIIQASGVHNMSSKEDVIQSRQVKRYISQLSFAKSQCEKRLNELGWMTYPVEQAVEASSLVHKEMLPLKMVLNHPEGRACLRDYLEQLDYPGLIGYWEAVEELRKAKHCDWHGLGMEIFYTYIHPPPNTSINPQLPSSDLKIDKSVHKRMEAFLLGNDGPEVFFFVQENIFKTLEERFYPAFFGSEFYQRMLSSMKSTSVADQDSGFDISLNGCEASESPAAVEEEVNITTVVSVPGESDYTRWKLSQLQDRLKNKIQALEALRTSLKPESRVLTVLDGEVEALQAEVSLMEAHVLRTEAWGEHLGQWRAIVQTTELSDDGSVQFVLVVHVMEDDKDITTGWVVLRKLQEFHALHRKLCQLSSTMKSMNVPSLSRKFRLAFGQSTLKESESSWLLRAKEQIQKYLQYVLEDEKLNHSEALYTFLSPSSDHLKRVEPLPKKSKFSFSTLFKSSNCDHSRDGLPALKESMETDISLFCDEPEGSRSLGDSKDAIVEPLFELLNEICDLNKTFKWIRRTLITTIQVAYNRSINRAIRVIIADWFAVQNVYYCINSFIKSWWPLGVLVSYVPTRSAQEKKQTRNAASSLLLNNIPLVLSNLVGFQNAQLGVTKVFNALQDHQLNKQLFYELLDIFLHELYPELKNE